MDLELQLDEELKGVIGDNGENVEEATILLNSYYMLQNKQKILIKKIKLFLTSLQIDKNELNEPEHNTDETLTVKKKRTTGKKSVKT
jgi:hypothetical protein